MDWIISIAVTLVLKKMVKRPYLGRFKPDLAQILAKGRPGLLFHEKIGLPIEKTEFSSFSQSPGDTGSERRFRPTVFGPSAVSRLFYARFGSNFGCW